MTRSLFDLFPEIVEFADGMHTLEQHVAFDERPEQTAGKHLAMNIRRLPSWMLSFHIWRSTQGLYPDFEPTLMLSPHQMSQSSDADAFLMRYIGMERKPTVQTWIRCDRLLDDFLAFVGNYTEVTPERRAQAERLPKLNEQRYDKDISHWFTTAQIDRMYERNPLWSQIETYAYDAPTMHGQAS